MVNYRKILEHHFNGMTQRTIEVAVGSSRHTIREIINKAEEKKLEALTDEMTDGWKGCCFLRNVPKQKVIF